ncbi:D-alanyl-D-alanine carboxypeptidase [Jiella sp. KSK16Y-1]|uniref:D-alanyl-D-alanine carboxypeptidase n=1 Tax=Jiella mangrovi TaxID=2821407 RepID=A0ABS4BFA1_9HYPH|nr:D-alanyl-D-alanine carboxypeptidase [Jiella mangrovi]MBP0615431.1 D-alanyl-D-alanine carboxypeptidase [Jiella mangrovi]
MSQLRRAARSAIKLSAVAVIGAGVLLSGATGEAGAANPKYAGFVIDANNGKVLYQDRADEYRYPASLTKMMTLYLTFEALKSGKIHKGDKMPVSAYASGRPPSKLGLRPGTTITVEEAIYSLVTKSANDAAVVLAEYLAGSEAQFARRMTDKAHRLGMTRTEFRNANGLPNPDQHTTARDMATLGIALREHFPEYYDYFSTRSFNFRGRRIGNHNRVLNRYNGVDGIKTGYINASGFNLVTSVKTDGKSVVAAVFGGTSGRSRDDHMVDLLKRYMPKASRRDTGPLIAAKPNPNVQVASAEPDLPKRGPIPDFRPATGGISINDRIAMAYGSDAGNEIAARMPLPTSRPLVGRDAIRAALVDDRPALSNAAAAILPLARPAAARAVKRPSEPLMRQASVDGAATGSIDRETAAEVVQPSKPSSPWVVQIAATESASQAMSMLSKAKAAVGSPLAQAEPFTESISTGGSTLYRARFAGFGSKDQAWKACAALKNRSYNCYAVPN